ncbi:nucleobase:cation symporter-2 family protein [Clostridium sp. Marseille-Q2269]|uniref:nucleobase:cation symporter-2 family protein n=1 Tax=Clostridium sp. Marseille-Q2269 TaxID=2942205 RepID=UPI002073876D|nr:nucleobase:cation symporter-2 family protein [Clostridium sp. Marseille-Q2269]
MDSKVNNETAPVDELLPPQQLFILGLQHVLAMCAGAVAVPLIIGGALKLSADQIIFLINADLFVSGIATLVQSLGVKNFIGAKVPVIEGASFASVSAIIAIANTYPGDPVTGITTIFGATFVAGLFCFIMAPFFGKLIRFFPKVVTGTVITIIGLSLLPVAVKWCAGNDVKSPTFGSPKNILLALFVLILTLIMYRFFKGILGNISILLGIIIGTIVASMLGMSDFSRVNSSGWINIDIPLYFGMIKFNLTAIISMILVMLVMMTEATGNMMAIHELVDKKIDDKNLTRGLRTDGFATMLAGIFNTFPHTAFGQNVGLINLTGVKSRFVVATSGGILILLGLFPKAGAVVASIPYPVLGGAGIAMFGMVASGGISTLGKVEFKGTKNAMIIAVSIGLSMIPLAVPTFYSGFPQWVETLFHSGITTGSLTAIILNLFFNELGKSKNSIIKENIENGEKVAKNI